MQTRIVAIALFVSLTHSFALAQAEYKVTDLGRLSPTAINDWAQVVGNINDKAYIWSFGHTRALGILPGGSFSNATAINELGVVTGFADGPGTVFSPYSGTSDLSCTDLTQPVIWKNGHIQPLNAIGFGLSEGGADWCSYAFTATGINGSNEVVGYTAQYPNEYQWGFLWTNGQTTNLPVVFFLSAGDLGLFTGMDTADGDGWPPTLPSAISNAGQVVGQNGVYFNMGHATSWKSGVATDLGPPDVTGYPNFFSSSANGVNAVGQIAGWATTAPIVQGACYYDLSVADCPMQAVMWNASGAMTPLGTLPGDAVSAAVKINFFGFVIGSSGNEITAPTEGVIPFVGPLQVVGRPFLWSRWTGMQDLNTLIPANSGWVLNSVTDINVWGQIVGQGTLNGRPHGFLLTPKLF